MSENLPCDHLGPCRYQSSYEGCYTQLLRDVALGHGVVITSSEGPEVSGLLVGEDEESFQVKEEPSTPDGVDAFGYGRYASGFIGSARDKEDDE